MLRSFRSAMVLFIVVAAFLPVLVISVPFVAKIYAMTRQGAVRELRLSAERVAADLQHEMEFVHSHFVATGRNNDLVLAVSSPFFGFRGLTLGNELLASSSALQAVYLFDARHELVEALPEASASQQVSGLQRHLHQLMADGEHWRGRALWTLVDDPALLPQGRGRSGDARMLVLAMPLYFEHYVQDRTDMQQGLLVALIPLRGLLDIGARHLQTYQRLQLRPAWQVGPTAETGWQRAAAALHIRDSEGLPLRLSVEVSEPDRVRMHSVHETLVLLFLFVAAAMALFATLAFMLARRMGLPLLHIRKLAHAYAAGNYQPATAPIDFEEFRQVARALAVMGQRINDQLVELRTTNAQLVKADKLKDDFLATTSHELRTPLHGIIGIASSLQELGAADLSPQVRHNLQLIEHSGRRLENLVNDILDISRIRNNALALDLRPVEIFSLVDVVVSLHGPEAESLGVSLQHSVPRSLPPVLADEFRLQQILHNLVGNALKFAGQNLILLHAEVEGHCLRVGVIDQGPGIPSEQLEAIFQPFTRLGGTLTQRQPGTGLGLAIARRLVELQGGRMDVVSTPGQGSTFSFTLPLAAPALNDDPQPAQAPASFDPDHYQHPLRSLHVPLASHDTAVGGARQPLVSSGGLAQVLVVDDEHINIQILANYFHDEPYVLHVARSGAEALERLDELEQVDLILLDVMMPKMSGFEVCCRVRANPRYDAVPILLLTARNQARDIHHGFHYGCNDYLVKPVSRVELLTRCHYHLQFARIKQELTRLRAQVDERVRERSVLLRQELQEQAQNADHWRELLDIGLELMPLGSPLILATCVERLGRMVPGGGVAIIHGRDVVSQLPLAAHSALHLAVHEHLDWRDTDWLRRHELEVEPVSDPQGCPIGDLLLYPPQAVPAAMKQRMAALLGAMLWRHRQFGDLQHASLEDMETGTGNERLLHRTLQRLERSFARYPDRHAVLLAVRVAAPGPDEWPPGGLEAAVLTTHRLLNTVLRQSDQLFRVESDLFAVLLEPCTFLQAIQIRSRLLQREARTRVVLNRTGEGDPVELPLCLIVAMGATEFVPPDRLWPRALAGLRALVERHLVVERK